MEQIAALREGYVKKYKDSVREEVGKLEDIRDNASSEEDIQKLAEYAE